MEKQLILDFNDPNLEFKISDIKNFKLNAIYKNIDKFNEFTYNITATEVFDIIYNCPLFQLSLANTDNSVDDILYVYNMIASDAMIDNKQYPTIMKKTFIKLMKLKGFDIRRKHVKTAPYVYQYKTYFIKRVNI